MRRRRLDEFCLMRLWTKSYPGTAALRHIDELIALEGVEAAKSPVVAHKFHGYLFIQKMQEATPFACRDLDKVLTSVSA